MLAAVILALVLLSLLMLSLPPGEKFIKGIAEGKLSDLLGQEVRIGSLETNLFSRLQLHDLRIYRVQSTDTIPLLSLGGARIKYRLVDLLRRPLSIGSASLDDLFLSVSRDSSGAYNIPLLASDGKSQEFP